MTPRLISPGYECDVSGSDERTEYIDLQTPCGRYPTIEQVRNETDEHTCWTTTFDVEASEEPRTFTVRSIAESIALIEANQAAPTHYVRVRYAVRMAALINLVLGQSHNSRASPWLRSVETGYSLISKPSSSEVFVTVVQRDRLAAGPRRSRVLAYSVFGLGIILIVSLAAPNMPWRLLGLLLISGGVVVLARGLWSTFGTRGAEPATNEDVFNAFSGGALVTFGLALLMIPLINLRSNDWRVIAVAGAGALVALYGSALFLVVSAFARRGGD